MAARRVKKSKRRNGTRCGKCGLDKLIIYWEGDPNWDRPQADSVPVCEDCVRAFNKVLVVLHGDTSLARRALVVLRQVRTRGFATQAPGARVVAMVDKVTNELVVDRQIQAAVVARWEQKLGLARRARKVAAK